MDSTKWDSLKLYFTRIFRFCLILCFKAVVDASDDVAYEASTVMVVVTGEHAGPNTNTRIIASFEVSQTPFQSQRFSSSLY